MKIKNLKIVNFRAIRLIEVNDLEDTIVIAGPNGCGKSCIFDAIRLLKSAYGGYEPNEWHQWFGEFEINLQNLGRDVKRILNEKDKALQISICFEFSEEEIIFFRTRGEELIEKYLWKQIPSNPFGGMNANINASELMQYDALIFEKNKTD